jgi:hypothetical protein
MTTPSVSLFAVQGTIARALAHRPVDRSRIEKAAALICLGHVEQVAPDTFNVRSQTAADTLYMVTPRGCSCPDATRRPNDRCKHEWAARIVVAAEMAQQAQTERAIRARFTADSVAFAYASAHRRAA